MSVNETLVEAKCEHSPLNLRILSLPSVPFTLTTVQVPNFSLVETKRITVYLFVNAVACVPRKLRNDDNKAFQTVY